MLRFNNLKFLKIRLFSSSNPQTLAFSQLKSLIESDYFQGWTTNPKISQKSVEIVKSLQTPMETGPYVKLRMQPDGILNDHKNFIKLASESGVKFPYKKLLKEEFWSQTVFKEIARHRIAEKKHLEDFNQQRKMDISENYDLRPFDIVIDGSNLYYKLTDLRSFEKLNKHEGKDDRLLAEGFDLKPEVKRIWGLLFETLFNAQTIFHNTYNSKRTFLKIAVLSKNDKALQYLTDLFSNNLEPKFSNIDVQCCKLANSQSEDEECIALALHEKAILLTDDSLSDHSKKVSLENQDLFNYWLFHSHYCTSRTIYGNIS